MTIAIYKHATTVNYTLGVYTFDEGWLVLESPSEIAIFEGLLAGLSATERAKIARVANPADIDLDNRTPNDGAPPVFPGIADTALALQNPRVISASGDASGQTPPFDGRVDVDMPLTLATVNDDVGAYGTATHSPRITFNGKGLATAVEQVLITPSFANITNKPTTLAGYGITDAVATGGLAGSATILATGRTIAMTGDVTWTTPAFNGSANVTAAGTLATVNSTPGTFGSATQVAQITVDAKGRVTAITQVLVTPSFANLTGKPTTLAGYGITDAASSGGQVFTGPISATNLSGINTGDQTTITGNAGTATALQTSRTISITGDGTWTSGAFNGTANVTGALTLSTVNSNVGSFGSATQTPTFTVDAKGRITVAGQVTTAPPFSAIASKPTTLAGYGITDALGISATAVSATQLATGRTISITGDITYTSPAFNGTGNVTAAGTLATVNSNVGTYGSVTAVPIITVDGKGRITAVTTAALGTAAAQNTGTSGATIPFCNGNITWGGTNTFTNSITLNGPVIYAGNNETILERNVNGVTSWKIANNNVGVAVQSRLVQSTGSANAFVIHDLFDNNGAAFYTMGGGPGVDNFFSDFQGHYFRNRAGTIKASMISTGAFSLGSSTGTDARFLIFGEAGGFGRLTQWSAVGTSVAALNIMAAKNSGGGDSWCAWGVDATGSWRINQGTTFNGTGLILAGSACYWFTETALDAVSFLPFQVKGGISIDTNTTASTSCMSFFNGQGSGTRVGWIGTSGSSTSFNTSSDERLKENIDDSEDSGEIIDAIRVRQFDWKINGVFEPFGLITQELLPVVPQVVSLGPTPDDMQAADFSKLVPLTVKELQMIRSRERTRDEQIAALTAQVAALAAQLSAMS